MGIYSELRHVNKTNAAHGRAVIAQAPARKSAQKFAQKRTRASTQGSALTPAAVPEQKPKVVRIDERGRGGRQVSKDAVELFNFHIRHDQKARIQVDLPVAWRDELIETAHKLGVGKLELYRYAIGHFLGKTQREQGS